MAKLAQAFVVLAALPGAALANPSIPEPGILPLLGLGLVAAAVIKRRRK